MDFPFGFDLTVNRGGGVDKFGDPLPTTSHTVSGCAAAPAGSVEHTGDAGTVIDQDTVYAPHDADVVATDTVTVPAGQAIDPGTYYISGRPQRYQNPFTGTQAGTVLRLTRSTG